MEDTSKPYLLQVRISNKGSGYSMRPMNYRDKFPKCKLPIGRDDMKNLLNKIEASDNETISKNVMNKSYDDMLDLIDKEGAIMNIWSSKYPMEDFMAVEQAFREITLTKSKYLEREIFKAGTKIIIEEKVSLNKEEQIAYNYLTDAMNRKVLPDNIFLHGRKDKADDLDTGYVIMATKSWEVARSYGNTDTGSLWVLEAPKNSPKATDIVNTVYEKLKQDYKVGRLSYDMDYYGEYSFEEFEDVFNITEIEEWGQAWDNADFVEWFIDSFPKIYAVILPDGHYGDTACVFLDASKVNTYGISNKKYKEIVFENL
jgi:hypothetical protein